MVRIAAHDVPPIEHEAEHADAGIEWWFAQGCYEGPGLPQRRFMCSFFRHALAPIDGEQMVKSTSLSLAVLEAGSDRHSLRSLIEPTLLQHLLDWRKRFHESDLDRNVIDAYVHEAVTYGPPSPIRMSDAPVLLTADPFSITWDDHSLHQDGAGFRLAFTEPDGERRCQFTLDPLRPRLHMTGLGEPAIEPVVYSTCPTLELTGDVDGIPVTGRAWFDHQWGRSGWLLKQRSGGKVLGWTWCGINLDDGSDWIITIFRDMADRRCAVDQFAVICADDRAPRFTREVRAEAIRHWESPRTRIVYPIAWRFTIPDADAELIIEPIADDQELPTFGAMRATWEGAAVVHGTVAGRPVTGTARLELHGYGYILDFQQYVDQMVARVDQRIETFLPRTIDQSKALEYLGEPTWSHEPAAYTETIAAPMWDLMSRKGKHWRPILGLLMLEALGVKIEPYEELFCVVPELCHTAALVVDDVEDDSTIRRGDACLHLRYGMDVAINAANTVYFLPFLLVGNHPHLTERQRVDTYRLMVRFFVRSHFGQSTDIYWSRNMTGENLSRWLTDSAPAKLFQMYAYKTAAGVEGLTELACIIAGSDEATRHACASYARSVGVAFQIIDDANDFSDSPRRRKPIGEDLAAGKLTYVIVRAMEQLSGADGARLRTILSTRELRADPSACVEGIDLVRRSGVIARCREEAHAMVEDAWKVLSRHIPPSEPKTMLRALCSDLVNLAHDA